MNRVEEDHDGVTLWFAHLDAAPAGGMFVARSLGRFAGAELASYPWLARNQLTDRIRRVEHNGGWPTLARTTVADVADRLWTRRGHYLTALSELPQVPQHGDPTPGNLIAHDARPGDRDRLGHPGHRTGRRRPRLLQPELARGVRAPPRGVPHGAAAGLATREQVELGARVCAVYTVISRAEWALARAAHGSGALVGKFEHPSVAPYLRSLQRQFPQVEALL